MMNQKAVIGEEFQGQNVAFIGREGRHSAGLREKALFLEILGKRKIALNHAARQSHELSCARGAGTLGLGFLHPVEKRVKAPPYGCAAQRRFGQAGKG